MYTVYAIQYTCDDKVYIKPAINIWNNCTFFEFNYIVFALIAKWFPQNPKINLSLRIKQNENLVITFLSRTSIEFRRISNNRPIKSQLNCKLFKRALLHIIVEI